MSEELANNACDNRAAADRLSIPKDTTGGFDSSHCSPSWKYEMNHYTTTIHIRCPFQPVWDYYEVDLQSGKMVQCEVFEECCDEVRGETLSQEKTADFIREALRERCPNLIFSLTVTGRHGANCKTVIKR